MASPSQFRQYLIAQDDEGNNIEVTRSSSQVGVLAFDTERQVFVHCHVLLEQLKNRRIFEERGRKFLEHAHSSRARLFEFGEDEGNAFYITENVDGETLRSYLASQSAMPVWLVVQLTVQVLEGMNALLEVGSPVPKQPLEAMRVWQCGAQALKVQVADLPMIHELGNSVIKPKQAKLLFLNEAQKLESFLCERMQRGALGDETMVEATPFAELLSSILGFFIAEAKSSFTEVVSLFETRMPLPPAGELAASLSPQPLVASFLARSQNIARSVMQSVRIQSQKVDLINPYALRGTLMKSGQRVLLEQVPPERITGKYPHESLSQMLNLSKVGKFPNLLPVVFLAANDGVECMAEPVIEGIALSDILEARRTLDPFEIHLLLTGLDAALRSLENSQRVTCRLRLEDVFLFTGLEVEKVGVTGLSKLNLTEWPIFSIVLRSHLCMHAMTGRGSNPAFILPLKPIAKKDTEPLWHGGWMAALSCLLLGFSDGMPPRQRIGIAEMDAVFVLLDDEMKRARKGNPSSRAVFLARYAKEIEIHAPLNAASPESWMELSGATVTKGRVAEVEKENSISVFVPEASMGEAERPMIGFAEALIQYPVVDEPESLGGLRPMRAAPQSLTHDSMESSWMSMHEKKPFWWHILWIIGTSMVLGLGLAHLSGRAFWKKNIPGTSLEIETIPASGVENIELPVAPSPGPNTGVTKLPLPAPILQEMDINVSAPISDSNKKNIIPLPVPISSKTPVSVVTTVMEPPNSTMSAGAALTAQLQTLRNSGKILPSELRIETEKAAQSGNIEAMLALGNLFLHGGVAERDERSAFNWYDKASKAGEIVAALPLAECYLQGWGTAPDYTLAVNLLIKASSNGESRAKDLLAVCYARGIGVTKDDAKAFALCTEAYIAGIPSACGNLGAMYLRGQGTAPDAERAVKLFEEGAKKNHAESMLLYAQSLEYGTGTAVNPAEATRWYQLAARLGNAEASNWCRKNNMSY